MREINDLINRMRDTDLSTRRHAIAHELRHSVAALDAADARVVGVKPLVWDDWDNADTVVGLYRVRAAGIVWAWTLDDDDVYLHGAVAANRVDAQAAAQADYDARIMSAITIIAPSDRIAEAAGKLELANDALCRARPQWLYDHMLAAGLSDHLTRLDDARRDVRDALRALAGKGE